MGIAENIAVIRESVASAAAQSGRPADDITLVAAAKTNTAQSVRQAVAAGVDAVGENRVQEMLGKLEQGAYMGVPLHFIGHLQKNKVRPVVGKVDLIQSVDSEPLLLLIDKFARAIGVVQDILIEVNIAGELSKSGVEPGLLEYLLEKADGLPGVRVRGLMAIPPISETPGANRRYFASMYKLFIDMSQKKYDNNNMKYLSMGMSQDFVDAILEGANMIRVGSSVFGARN